ncbi:MAG: ammonium transporter [Deltaproteobacteria bacterium]|nr:ammonium transporter [Deltaproteobacteria bacterium]MBN2673016.1 ammonium transporter [Deltaproteobacteria bacterium]
MESLHTPIEKKSFGLNKLWAVLGAFVLLIPEYAHAETPDLPIDTGTTAWMLISTALVLLMVPGLAMFYGGLVRTKNVLGTMMHSFAAMAIVGVLWVVVGYSMAFGPGTGWAGWDWDFFLLRGIEDKLMEIEVNGQAMAIPWLVFAMFQGKFAIITPALISGAFAERVRFKAYCIYIALWSLLVYVPLCHWVWSSDGFLAGKAIDFAGGTVIHISAGIAGLVAALYLGARRGYPLTAMHPSNLVMTMMGAGLLWVGWFGFNAGSSVASGLQTAQALTVTQVAAAAGAFAWILIEAIHHKKATSLGTVSGILAGLVAITPAAGDVTVVGAIALGVIASIICYFAIAMKNKLGYDDSLDVFGIHGVAGIVGAIGLTFFLRGAEGRPEFGTQLWYQTEGVMVSLGYAGVVSFVLVFVIDKAIGLKMNDEEQMAGMDHSIHGEHAYGMLNLD